MPFDLNLFADKLIKYRFQFDVTIEEISQATGVSVNRLLDFEQKNTIPDGDEILILADFYKCDFRFFLSDEKLAAFEQTEYLFRNYGGSLTRQDRWAIQEVLFLAECEDFLLKELGDVGYIDFRFIKSGEYLKQHGIDAALNLRKLFGYQVNEVPADIYEDFRRIGIHLFRRKLENSNISGICIRHPQVGNCVLVNYNEDVYRQRFTSAHEAGHSILDGDQEIVVSFAKWRKNDLREIRANNFASHYLLPPEFLMKIPDNTNWDKEKSLKWANRLKVSTEALAYSLSGLDLIDKKTELLIKSIRVPANMKEDPELSSRLSLRSRERKAILIQRGLSNKYVRLCFEAYQRKIISAARIAEMLLVTESELWDIAIIFGERIKYG